MALSKTIKKLQVTEGKSLFLTFQVTVLTACFSFKCLSGFAVHV